MAPLLKMTHISFTFNIWTKTDIDAGLGSRFYLHWSPWSQCQWCYQQQLRHQTCSMHRQNSAADTQRNREMREERRIGRKRWIDKGTESGKKKTEENQSYDAAATHRNSDTLLGLIPLPISHYAYNYEAMKSLKPLNIWTYFVYRASLLHRSGYSSHEMSSCARPPVLSSWKTGKDTITWSFSTSDHS